MGQVTQKTLKAITLTKLDRTLRILSGCIFFLQQENLFFRTDNSITGKLYKKKSIFKVLTSSHSGQDNPLEFQSEKNFIDHYLSIFNCNADACKATLSYLCSWGVTWLIVRTELVLWQNWELDHEYSSGVDQGGEGVPGLVWAEVSSSHQVSSSVSSLVIQTQVTQCHPHSQRCPLRPPVEECHRHWGLLLEHGHHRTSVDINMISFDDSLGLHTQGVLCQQLLGICFY